MTTEARRREARPGMDVGSGSRRQLLRDFLRESDGSVHVEWDRHVEGLFARADWLRLLSEVGFEPKVVPVEHSELEPGQYEVFVCSRAR